jgi:hypothetical protein
LERRKAPSPLRPFLNLPVCVLLGTGLLGLVGLARRKGLR